MASTKQTEKELKALRRWLDSVCGCKLTDAQFQQELDAMHKRAAAAKEAK
jgi:hypothetical protein